MKYFESFAGVGGIGLGLPKDWECVGFSEIDKYASQVLKFHYPNIQNYGDIKSIKWNEVPDFDLFIGGSPCQDLSNAGVRRGLEGGRSSLFFEYVRALREKHPSYFLWENVEGALNSSEGWDFAEVQVNLAESGYELWGQVLNSVDFLVSQNRERIFILGSRDGSPKEILFVPESNKEHIRKANFQRSTNTLTGRSAGGGNPRGNYIKQLNQPTHSNDRVYDPSGIAPTLNTMQGGNRQPFIRVTKDGFHMARNDKKKSSIQGTHVTFKGGVSHALQTGHVPMVLSSKDEIRRLTPRECERLMSWPDDWTRYGINEKEETIEISDSQRYKMCGNGVVSKVVKGIFDVQFIKNLI